MSIFSGFEGFEKRLELHFIGNDNPFGLRNLEINAVQQVLEAVQCTIVSAAGNHCLDAYILSESSLFVYPHKIIIKTCGTTQLLRSIPGLLHHTAELGLNLIGCRYSRGSFIFPQAQPFPHTSFTDEVLYLEECLPPNLCFRKSRVMQSINKSHSWHIYAAADDDQQLPFGYPYYSPTVEVCMTELDQALACRFYRQKGDKRCGDTVGAEMTDISGIHSINPQALICGFAFDPCGYSMNGLDGDYYSTIHVTPEDGHSYASFECSGDHWDRMIESVRTAISVFKPTKVSVSFCMEGYVSGEIDNLVLFSTVSGTLAQLGFRCQSRAVENMPGAGTVTYQTFMHDHHASEYMDVGQ